MRIAVVGGTGLVGRNTVEAIRRNGHEAVVIALSTGVDLATGVGLDQALAGVETTIDVTSVETPDRETTIRLFGTFTRNLLDAALRAKVKHHVLLSILGVDRIEGNPHHSGKRKQEELVMASAVPYTIVRATQFYEFAEMVVQWTRKGDVATVPPALMQPVAVTDVAATLAEVAAGKPQGRIDLAGPEPQDFVDMTRRVLAARGDTVKLVPSWHDGPYGVEAAGEVLLPGPEARIAPTTFDTWLEQLSKGSASKAAG